MRTKRGVLAVAAIVWMAALLLTAIAPYIISSQQSRVFADTPPAGFKFDWRNRQTIVGGDGSGWLDSNVTDGTQVFMRQGQKASQCETDSLDVKTKQGATEATLVWYIAPLPTDSNQVCSRHSQTVQIGSKQNYYSTYNWIDQGLIRHFKASDLGVGQDLQDANSLSAMDFKLTGQVSGNNRYLWTSNLPCRSYIDVNPNDPTKGKFTKVLGDESGTCFTYYTVDVPLAQVDNYKITAGSGGGSGNGGAAGDAKPKESCETNNAGRGLGWIVCDVLHSIDDSIDWIDKQIQELLIIKMDYFNDKSFIQAWGTIRNIALLVLVPIMLIMVIATALEIGPFDAYSVRKALPRFLFAVLFIVLSLPILKFLVQLSNVVETGILGLITSAFGTDVSEITLASLFNPKSGEAVTGFFGTIAAGGAAAAAFAGGAITVGMVLSFALVALVGLLIGYIVLAIRVMLVVGLVLLAPLAILPWIFPGNDKLWKMWKNTLTTMLLLGPILGAFIGVARMLAALDATPWWLKIIFYVGVYFLLATLVKSSGGVLGTFLNGMNDKAKGFFGSQAKFRANSRQKAWGKFRAGERGYFNSVKKAGFTTGAFMEAEKKGSFALSAVRNGGRMISKKPKTGYYAEAVAQQHKLNELRYSQTERAKATQEDDGHMLQAQTYRNAAEARARMGADWGIGKDDIDRSIAAVNATGGFSAARQNFATRQLARTGTGYKNIEQMHRTVARVAGSNQSMASDMLGEMNAVTKGVGRHDLAPGFGNQIEMYKQAQERGGYDAIVANGGNILTDEEYRAAHLQAAKDIDAVTLLRDKKPGVENMAKALEQSFTISQKAASDSAAMMNDPRLTPEQQAHAENEYRKHMAESARLSGYMGKIEQSGLYASVTNVDAAYDNALSSTSGIGKTQVKTIANEQSILVPTDGRQGVNAAANATQVQVNPTTGRLENTVYMTRPVIDPATGAPKIDTATGRPELEIMVDPITKRPMLEPNQTRSGEAAEMIRRHGTSGQGTNPNDPNFT